MAYTVFEVTAGVEAESAPRRRDQKMCPLCLSIALQHAVVGELEDVVAVDHRRELQQRVAVVTHSRLNGGCTRAGAGKKRVWSLV